MPHVAPAVAPHDAELIRRVAQRDTRAFAELYDRHSVATYSVARHICRRRDLAEEATQEAFAALWREAAEFDSGFGTPAAWLMTVARNRSVDVLRRTLTAERRRHDDDTRLHALAATEPLPHEAVGTCESARFLAAAVAQLSVSQREVIELAFYDGLTHREIATHLALPLGTVKGRVRLALSRLASDPGVLGLRPSL